MRVQDNNVFRVLPRERDRIMEYDRPGAFFAPDIHYFGYRIKKLPPRPRTVTYWGRTYYYYNNIYYRPWDKYYVVCRPPFGVCIDIALRDAMMPTVHFSYYHSVHHAFDIIDDNFRTINEQNKIIARNNAILAAQNANIAINKNRALSSYELAHKLGLMQSYANAAQEYYYEDGVFFILNSRNQYEVIVPPAGALVNELPDDYDTIVINGIEVYQVDDTVYRLVLVDGTPLLEVLGQMPSKMARQYGYYF